MVGEIMLIKYLGGIKSVSGGGCSTCKGVSSRSESIQRTRTETFVTLEGQDLSFNKDEIKNVSDKTGLMLLDLTYSYKGNIYNKFEVV